MTIIERSIQPYVEKYSFGVCSYLAEKWGLNEAKVRTYFIYSSFITFGSPLIIYLAAAFWINIKKYLRTGESLK
ncbi:MAG TPA: PspC family transcriptional regulator [Saprospiraceae bacterium]|jgi:phage shock protein C|nr:PspC family transcriptional regulator [Saprospiraceae bacterium]HMT53891.1 PspC family transcriptional regulator [Saprospiraceae bacterium]HMT70226.1 PspC family transcriptional regulator [Saprospiraceae bacterium]HQV98470.1 PspC family transcriptional regulator [Saprospiraceae bacterium]HRG41819.1 PspC family transcriptional regulator [Saprospiraceae bacterium]